MEDDYRNSQTCMAKTGLLFLKDCGSMVINNCQVCGRPICRVHSIETAQGILCPECAADVSKSTKRKIREDSGVQSAARRQTYYHNYGYVPYYYGHAYYYSDNDYRTFDGRDQVVVEPPEDGGIPTIIDDDGMES